MFLKSGKKELWLGMNYSPDFPELEISWGRIERDGSNRHRVNTSFENFIEDEMGQWEQGGSNSGGKYDDDGIDTFKNMIKVLKRAVKEMKKRNANA